MPDLKEEIVINDANIFIDLINIDLLEKFLKLDLSFQTTDFVIKELNDTDDIKQKKIVKKLITKGKKINIVKFKNSELNEMSKIQNINNGLSFTDSSCIFLAKKEEGILLTGDNLMRKLIEKAEIEVHGIVWVFDKLLEHNIINYKIAIEKMELLLEINQRLPVRICKSRIKKWSKKLK